MSKDVTYPEPAKDISHLRTQKRVLYAVPISILLYDGDIICIVCTWKVYLQYIYKHLTFDVPRKIYGHNMPVDRECLATKSSNCIFTVFTVDTNWYSTMVSTSQH